VPLTLAVAVAWCDVAVRFEHDVAIEPLRNSQGEAVLYKVRSRNVVAGLGGDMQHALHGVSAEFSPLESELAELTRE
jgi:hypothetical protein